MQLLTPILTLLEGTALFHEPVRSVEYTGNDITTVRFPAMSMRRVGDYWVVIDSCGDPCRVIPA